MAEYRQTEEGFRRLIAFSDAVVAIALTLLVLPLAEIPGEIRDSTSIGAVLRDHQPALVSFAVSFVVIWVLWRNHHRMMENFRAYDRTLFELHFLWLLTIVVLPFATALMDNIHIERANAVYIGVLAVSVLSLVAMTEWGARHPALLDDNADTGVWIAQRTGLASCVLLAVALAIAIAFPKVGVWPLVLLFFSGPLEQLLRRLRRAR
ncbi:TMEM175 family protein [Gordonia sp. LSe1-13]|uniref:TMEM175 family protein n=1 Tax=Gordonia sesuvii TaxID=3116777 RepID=A0ABU7M9R2_9ACTN|nr:TMEM175 family protein [Gordonia sp. LSe1-13]